MSARHSARLAISVLALLVLEACTSTGGFRARWYLNHVSEQPEAPTALYVLIENAGRKEMTVKGIHLNHREAPRAPVDWTEMSLDTGDILLAKIDEATSAGGKPQLLCRLPVRLYLDLEGKGPFGTARRAAVPIDGALPSSLPDEWLHCTHPPR